MTGYVVIISTLNDRSPHVWQLIQEAKKVATVVVVHTLKESKPIPGTTTVRADHVGLHFQKWANLGLDQCHGATAIINDDILISADDIAAMLAKAERFDLVTLPGRIGASPLTGWCFALNADKFRYDEEYVWHYGDDDLWEKAKADPELRIGVVQAAIVHDRGEHPRFPPELREQVRADKLRFQRKWGRGGRDRTPARASQPRNPQRLGRLNTSAH